MSDVVVTAASLIGAFALWACIVWVTVREAERRLGRELTLGEGLFAGLTFPYSFLYVWLVLPKPPPKR